MQRNPTDRIRKIVTRIPKGRVATYGDIARRADVGSARVVGNALHRNPDPAHIPCHRVVNVQGRVADAFAFGGAAEQERRLRNEGVPFIRTGVVDLKRCRWNGQV